MVSVGNTINESGDISMINIPPRSHISKDSQYYKSLHSLKEQLLREGTGPRKSVTVQSKFAWQLVAHIMALEEEVKYLGKQSTSKGKKGTAS